MCGVVMVLWMLLSDRLLRNGGCRWRMLLCGRCIRSVSGGMSGGVICWAGSCGRCFGSKDCSIYEQSPKPFGGPPYWRSRLEVLTCSILVYGGFGGGVNGAGWWIFVVGLVRMVGVYMGMIREWLGEFFVRDVGRGGLSGSGEVTVFVDESGDLGFGRGGSGWFVVGGVVTGDVRGVEGVVRRVMRGFGGKGNRKRGGRMLHARYETDGTTEERYCGGLGGMGNQGVLFLWWRKCGCRWGCGGDAHGLYRYCVGRLVCAVVGRYAGRRVKVVVSRLEVSKFWNVRFRAYVREEVLRDCGVEVDVLVVPAAEERGLQAADMVVWAVYQKYERGEGKWCDLLGGVEEIFYS